MRVLYNLCIDPAEIFPLRARAKGMSLAVSSNWLCNFAVGLWTPELFDKIGWATYLFYMAFNVIAFAIGKKKRKISLL